MSDILVEMRDAVARGRAMHAAQVEVRARAIDAPALATMRERWDIAEASVRYRRVPLRSVMTVLARVARAIALPFLREQSTYNAATTTLVTTLAADLETAATTGERRMRALEVACRGLDERVAALERERVGPHDAEADAGTTTHEGRENGGIRQVPAADDDGMATRAAGGDGGAATSTPFDAWHLAEAFRGSEETIRAKLCRYVDLFAGCDGVVDLACGRGEFLDLLRAAGVHAYGVDADVLMVSACRGKGLEVAHGDAIEHLRGMRQSSVSGIFSAQFIEHLGPARVWELVQLCHRAVRPGGVIVLETLNPESLLVLYRWFPLDPTHVWLVHPATLRLFCEGAGFEGVTVMVADPPRGPLRIPPLPARAGDGAEIEGFNRATAYLNEILYGGYEYAIVARRPQ